MVIFELIAVVVSVSEYDETALANSLNQSLFEEHWATARNHKQALKVAAYTDFVEGEINNLEVKNPFMAIW